MFAVTRFRNPWRAWNPLDRISSPLLRLQPLPPVRWEAKGAWCRWASLMCQVWEVFCKQEQLRNGIGYPINIVQSMLTWLSSIDRNINLERWNAAVATRPSNPSPEFWSIESGGCSSNITEDDLDDLARECYQSRKYINDELEDGGWLYTCPHCVTEFSKLSAIYQHAEDVPSCSYLAKDHGCLVKLKRFISRKMEYGLTNRSSHSRCTSFHGQIQRSVRVSWDRVGWPRKPWCGCNQRFVEGTPTGRFAGVWRVDTSWSIHGLPWMLFISELRLSSRGSIHSQPWYTSDKYLRNVDTGSAVPQPLVSSQGLTYAWLPCLVMGSVVWAEHIKDCTPLPLVFRPIFVPMVCVNAREYLCYWSDHCESRLPSLITMRPNYHE